MGFAEISGFYSGLSRGFQELGVRATMVDLGTHRFQYSRPRPPALVRAAESLSRRRAAGGGGAWFALVPAACVRIALFAWAVLRHDVFVFGFGTSFFKLRELRLLKALGKTVIFQFHGSDGRPAYIDGAVVQSDAPEEVELAISQARQTKARLGRIDRYADYIVNNPSHGHFHESPIVVWLRLGLPNRPPEMPSARSQGDRVRVLHCPSHLGAKGTHEIRDIVARLSQRLPIDYVEVSGQPHEIVLRELARCDLVIDQLYADYGMPGFATEAAWYSKPVLIGGFAVELWRLLLPLDEQPATQFCRPEAFESELARLVGDASARAELGRRAREFVERRWSPPLVAQRYLQLADNACPSDWLYNPRELRYVHGCGLSEAASRAIVRAVVEKGGAAALQLRDKPELEAAFLEHAR